MPYAGVPDSEIGKLDECVQSVMAKGHEQSSAIGICRASMNLSDTPVIRWVEPFQYTAGKAFRVMPLGTFKRGERTLEVTRERALEMANNYAAGRPRWTIPIYLGHPTPEQPDPPKAGNIKRMFVQDDGLYAEPEYAPDGEKAVGDGAYQYVSPGVLWKLNGSAYTDDQGKEFDNVIDHVAFTNRPFFGNNVALFSSEPFAEHEDHSDHQIGMMKRLMAQIAPAWGQLMKLVGAGQDTLLEENQEEEPEEASAEGTGEIDVYEEASHKESNMADQFTVTAEEFNALKAKANQVDALVAETLALKTQAETFAGQLQSEKDARRREALVVRCEKFMAIPEKSETLAEKLHLLEKAGPELFAYFDKLLASLDTQLVQAGLFSEQADARGGTAAEDFVTYAEKVWADEFKSDPAKWSEAMNKAAALRPDLAREHMVTPG